MRFEEHIYVLIDHSYVGFHDCSLISYIVATLLFSIFGIQSKISPNLYAKHKYINNIFFVLNVSICEY